MPNNIKGVGAGDETYALQCTTTAKENGFVHDADAGMTADNMCDVYVAALDDIILVYSETVDEKVRTEHLANLALNYEHATIGPCRTSKMQTRGNGCQVNLPSEVIDYVGFEIGMPTGLIAQDELMVIYDKRRRDGGKLVSSADVTWSEITGL